MLFSIFLLLSNSHSDEFIDASVFYKKGEYQKALEIYAKHENKNNPYILYNIGNCYYKLNNTPKALAYYIKAFNLNPRVPGLKENMIKAALENGEELFSQDIPQILYSIYYSLSEYEIITLFEILFILLALLLIIKTRTKNNNLNQYIAILLILTSICGTWYLMRKNSLFHRASITLTEADLYSGPSTTFPIIATIPQGHVMEVLSEKDDFIEVGIIKENIKGWIKPDNIIKAYLEGG